MKCPRSGLCEEVDRDATRLTLTHSLTPTSQLIPISTLRHWDINDRDSDRESNRCIWLYVDMAVILIFSRIVGGWNLSVQVDRILANLHRIHSLYRSTFLLTSSLLESFPHSHPISLDESLFLPLSLSVSVRLSGIDPVPLNPLAFTERPTWRRLGQINSRCQIYTIQLATSTNI